MYFKIKINIREFNFPALHDFRWDMDKKTDVLYFRGDYSLFFSYGSDVTVLLPVEFEKITQGYVLSYIDIPTDMESILCKIIPSYPLMDVEDLKEKFWTYSADIHEKLVSYMIRTVDMLRWRFALKGEHNYLKNFEDYCYSLDGKIWFKMPFKENVTIKVDPASAMSYNLVNEAHDLMQIYNKEPLEHEMYREAYNNKSNPRSSLIMAISSAEVGFKRLASELHPQNEWLLENIQSPPLPKMLKDYLPLLPTKLKINDKFLAPPKHIMKTIDKAVQKRNKLVHTGISETDEKELLEILDAINDLLYLFDYYKGFKWALGHLSLETKRDLNLVKIIKIKPKK